MGGMDKRALFEKIRDVLRAELAAAEKLARETAAAANHPEARPENDKDTRKIELSYLAAGQAARAEELRDAVAQVGVLAPRSFAEDEPLHVGALVELEVDGRPQRVLLCPAGGGLKVADAAGEISVVTPQSPLGRGLIGRTSGEAFELQVAGKVREVEIVGVA